MRLVVFFDLPVETARQRKNYRQFRKFLIKEGYLMMQESVYAKLVMDFASAEMTVARLKKNRPKEGLVQVLKVTEKQFAGMVEITNDSVSHAEINDMNRLIVL